MLRTMVFEPIVSGTATAWFARHPLYMCPTLNHDHMTSSLKSNSLCMKPGHFVKNCKSLHRCLVCQKPHHTLLHFDERTKGTDTHASDAKLNPRGSDSLFTCCYWNQCFSWLAAYRWNFHLQFLYTQCMHESKVYWYTHLISLGGNESSDMQ